jgi:tetratricopeptide (TPR) repeat protein
MFRAEAARDDAEAARQAEAERAKGEQQAKQEALDRQAETQAVLDFVENKVFAAARPKDQEGGLGYDVKLADAVKAALPFIDKSFVDKPLIEGRLRMTIGRSFLFLGDPKTAMEQYKSAREIFTEHRGRDHRDTLKSMIGLANSYEYAGRAQEALRLREETLQLAKAELGRDDPLTLATMNSLANSYDDTFGVGRRQEALRLREETLHLVKAKLGSDDPLTLASMHNLANSYHEHGRNEEAIKLREETLRLEKAKLGPAHPSTLLSMINLALSYRDAGRAEEAIKLLEVTLPIAKAKLGPNHHFTLVSMNNLAISYGEVGRIPEALKLYEEALQLLKAKLGLDQNPATALELANTLAALGRWDQALAALDKAVKLDASNHWHWFCASVLQSYLGDVDGYRQSSREMLKRFGSTRDAVIAERVAKTCSQGPDAVGNFDQVVKLADLAVEKCAWVRFSKLTKGMAEYRAGHYAATVKVLNSLCPTARAEHLDATAFALPAMSRHRLGRGPEARAALNSAQAILAERMPDPQAGWMFMGDWDDWLRAEIFCREALGLLGDDGGAVPFRRGSLLARQGKFTEAAVEFQKAIRIRPDWAEAQHILGLAHAQSGHWEQALAANGKAAELDPGNDWYLYHAAAFQLRSGDLAGYRCTCRVMLERFAHTDAPEVADRTARTCLLAPDAVSDLDPVLKLADRAVAGTEESGAYRWFVFVKALAEYRSGRDAQAVQWLERFSPDANGMHIDATAFAVLAMARHRLGRSVDARSALDTAHALFAKRKPDPDAGRVFDESLVYDGSLDWLHCQILLHEAEGLLNRK